MCVYVPEVIKGDQNICFLNLFGVVVFIYVTGRWRKQIGMIDDHDECEWVNVSSGTGSPGLSRTNSTEP